MAVGDTPGDLPDNRGVCETCHIRLLFFCLFLLLIFLSGCAQQQLEADRYLRKAHKLSQNFQYRQALEYYHKARQIYETIEDPQTHAEILYNIATLYFELQQYEHALKYYTRSLESLQFIQEGLQIKILNNIGVIYRYLNIYEEALDSFEQAREILERAKNIPKQEAFLIHLNRVVTLTKLGKKQQGVEILEGLLTPEDTTKYAYETALTQAIMGIIEAEYFKDVPKALEYSGRALTVFEKLDKKYDVAFSYHNIGLLHAEQEKYQEAIEYYNRSIDLCEEIGDQQTAWRAYYNLGNLYNKQSNVDKALENYQRSIDVIESIWSELRIDDFKTSFLEDKIDVYKRIIELLWENGRNEDAFDYLERAKSRALVDLLGNQKIRVWEGIDEDLIKEREQIDEKIRKVLQELNEEYSKPSEKRKRVGRLTETLQQERQDYQKLLHEIQVNNPEYASLVSVNPLTVKGIQNLIPDDGTALLEYLILEDKTLIFILTRDELHVEEVEVTQKRLQGTVLAFRIDIEREIPGWQEKSRWLYSKLIHPAEKHLRDIDTLCIIPYGILHYLPFGALQAEPDNRFLLEQPYDVFYAPSSTVLKFAFDKRKQHPLTLNQETLALIFTNPDKSLTYAEEEAEEIQKLYPQATLLKKSEATEEKVKDLAGSYHLIHLATHGILDPVQPLFSCLVLADGFLEVHEILNEITLDNSSLVALSACNTALGKRTEGDEILGLIRAFIYAGAPSIVASLWAVDDQSTALLMQRFYQNLKKENKARALKQAQISLFRDTQNEKFTHPYYWATFQLTGDYR